MLAFRAFIYPKMYIAPNDPYGISDLIELGLYCLFLIITSISLLEVGLILWKGDKKLIKHVIYLIALYVILYSLWDFLHSLVARIG